MYLVFADANAYLDAYRKHRMDNYHALLKSLSGLGNSLIVTETVVREVERNRLKVYVDNNKVALPRPSNIELSLLRYDQPDEKFRDPDVEAAMKGVRSAQQDLSRAISEAQRQLDRLHLENQKAIVTGRDVASGILSHFFSRARPHTPGQLERARFRRETGQPPGKQDSRSPLGDQISWEQILDEVRAVRPDSFWIISRDGDYSVEIGKERFLRPTLAQEISQVRRGITTRVFPDLAEFTKARRHEMPDGDAGLPTTTMVDDARAELEEALAHPEARRTWADYLKTGGLAAFLRPGQDHPAGMRNAKMSLRVAMDMAGIPQEAAFEINEDQAERLLGIIEAGQELAGADPGDLDAPCQDRPGTDE